MPESLGAKLTSTGYVPYNAGGFDELFDSSATHRKVVGVRYILRYCPEPSFDLLNHTN